MKLSIFRYVRIAKTILHQCEPVISVARKMTKGFCLKKGNNNLQLQFTKEKCKAELDKILGNEYAH